jgi:cell division protein FtsI/penicillin-binding protein 2
MTTAFGIGVKTDIDLPGEVALPVRLPIDPLWHISDLATNSYGQGLAVTPIQMIAAVAAIANKGIMMRPYIVSNIPGAGETSSGPGPLRRSVKPETAATMTDWLVSVVDLGVKEARVPGYKLAGKTGTGLIPPPGGTYNPDETIASFVGYGPAENPRFVILVRIDRPQVRQTGAEVAAPVFKNIAQWLLAYMKIPPADLQAQR